MQEVNYGSCMHQIYCRKLPLPRNIDVDQYKKGSYIRPHRCCFDNETFPIKVRYDGKERRQKEIKELSTYHTIKVIPDLVVAMSLKTVTNENMGIRRCQQIATPDRKSALKIGSAKAVLKVTRGSRHKLSSKLQKNEMDCKVAAGIIADSLGGLIADCIGGSQVGTPKTEENTNVVVEKIEKVAKLITVETHLSGDIFL